MEENKANSEVLVNTENLLGEGLYVTSNGLFWLDIISKKLFVKFDCRQVKEFTLPEMASSVWKVDGALVYMVSVSGVCTFNLNTKSWTVLARMPEKKIKLMRANDGIGINNDCFLFGTMELEPTGKEGALYIYNGKRIVKIYDGIGIPNSFIKVSDNTFLISDSFEQKVYRFTLNKQLSAIIKKTLWLDLAGYEYTPDGGCCDDKSYIYLSMWDGYCINKYDNNANLVSVYKLSVKRPTNCKISNDKKHLVVTTAREGIPIEQLTNNPYSGSLLQIRL